MAHTEWFTVGAGRLARNAVVTTVIPDNPAQPVNVGDFSATITRPMPLQLYAASGSSIVNCRVHGYYLRDDLVSKSEVESQLNAIREENTRLLADVTKAIRKASLDALQAAALDMLSKAVESEVIKKLPETLNETIEAKVEEILRQKELDG